TLTQDDLYDLPFELVEVIVQHPAAIRRFFEELEVDFDTFQTLRGSQLRFLCRHCEAVFNLVENTPLSFNDLMMMENQLRGDLLLCHDVVNKLLNQLNISLESLIVLPLTVRKQILKNYVPVKRLIKE